MLSRTNQLQILNLISMILIGHPIYVALIGVHDLQHKTLYSSLNTTTTSLSHKHFTEFRTMEEV